ncbi:cytochrome P450 2U1-like protein [Leptotrombidium deliense]|uniref:Cytochrome P450 2U1-like protein n=1 Tax=Leptotrombidium deliense TaxID=299467 RepID=A0A443S7W8_9ACAR|nr:cytochrome P450 2U1-like protein [Leptotrombidium deliense]
MDAYVKEDENFSGRPVGEFSVFGYVFGKEMVMQVENKFFSAHKKFLLSSLGSLGMGKTFFDEVIINECNCLIAKIEKFNDVPFDISDCMIKYSSNINFGIIFGKSIEDENTIFKTVRSTATPFFASIPEIDGYYTGNWYYLKKKIEPNTYNEMRKVKELLYECTKAIFRDRLNSEKQNGTKLDLLDYYVDAFKRDTTNTFTGFLKINILNNFSHYLEDAIIGNINIFLFDTSWMFFTHIVQLMSLNVDIQHKVQNEIDDIIGKENEITNQHKALLNYTQAVLAEIERFVCFVPLGIVRVNHNMSMFKHLVSVANI